MTGPRTAALAAALAALGALAAPPAAAAGTHAIAEAQVGWAGGAVFPERPDGLGLKLTLGGGGKLAAFPTRFYAIASLTLNRYHGDVSTSLDASELDRSWVAWSLGLRTLTPVWRQVRLLADVSLGRAVVDSTARLNGGAEELQASAASFVLELGLGAQVRVAAPLSLGLRVDLARPTGLFGFDLAGEAAGARGSDAGFVNTSVLGTITVHL